VGLAKAFVLALDAKLSITGIADHGPSGVDRLALGAGDRAGALVTGLDDLPEAVMTGPDDALVVG
jgi:hypothetical protein